MLHCVMHWALQTHYNARGAGCRRAARRIDRPAAHDPSGTRRAHHSTLRSAATCRGESRHPGIAMTILQLLLLIWIANGAPVLAHALFGTRFAYPVDGGARFLDGRPFFGTAKTVRGVIAAVLLTTLAAVGLGLSPALGALVGSAAVAGDLLTSFIKRRMGLPPSSRARGLDQVPESLLPALVAAPRLGLAVADIALVVGMFVVLAVGLSPVLCRIRVRETPH